MSASDPYTKVPKWLMRAFIAGELTPRESRVAFEVCELTRGFNRASRPVSATQLAEATGIHPNHVRVALRSLTDRGILVESEGGIGLADEQPNRLLDSTEKATKSVAKTNQIGCSKQPNRLLKTTKSVADTASKPSDNAGSGNAKETFKETLKETSKPPLPPKGDATAQELTEWFNRVWKTLVLRKSCRDAALALILSKKPDQAERDKIERYLVWLNGSEEWTKDRLRYYAHFRTILHQRRYNDLEDIEAPAGPTVANPFASKDWGEAFYRNLTNAAGKVVSGHDVALANLAHEIGIDPMAAMAKYREAGLDAAAEWVWSQRKEAS